MNTSKQSTIFTYKHKGEGSRGLILDFIESFSELIFCNGLLPGVLFTLLCIFCNLNIAGAALVSMVTLYLFIRIIDINWVKHNAAYMIYNPILVGMSIGVIFKLSPSVILVISITTILAFILTIAMAQFFRSMALPILSLPFAVVSTAFYLAATSYSRLFSLAGYNTKQFAGYDDYLPEVAVAFFKAFGTIVFMPNILVGGIIFLIILCKSRIMAFHAISAFFTGVCLHSLMISSFEQALLNPYAFNYILVGLALGGVFLLPSLRTTLVCLLAVGTSVILVDATGGFAQLFNIPVFTLPFNFTVIVFIYALRAVSYSDMNNDIRQTPEDSLVANKIYNERFSPHEASIGLPLATPVTVYQAQNGSWTHKDKWRYAYDFVITDQAGKMGQGDESLENNYIFGSDIIAPVAGYIVACCDAFPDNPIGKVDHINNWGNYIIIRTVGGLFVEISHLMSGSLMIKNGDYVELGQNIGKCGNSGFSPVPHVHVQVQQSALLGDETLPFNLAIYKSGDTIYCAENPKEGEVIEPVTYNYDLSRHLNLNLATVHKYALYENDKLTGELVFSVKRNDNISSIMFLEDQTGAKLFFAFAHGIFYFYDYSGIHSSPLKMLFIALPRLPLINLEYFEWRDSLPATLTGNGLNRLLFPLKAWLCKKVRLPQGNWRYDNGKINGLIESTGGTTVEVELLLDPVIGIQSVRIGKNELKLVK